ncbi:MAG TPA: putative Ig domain-containing protein, partial [Acidimicrobiia bacterium]
TSGDGGAIWVEPAGTLSVSQSRIDHNAAGGAGGGILAAGDVTLADSTIDANAAGAGGGGVGVVAGGSLTIIRSTISANSAGGHGGGVLVAGTAAITNSTISGNLAGGNGGGLAADGGTASISYSTIADNLAGGTGGVDGAVTIEGSILGENGSENCSPGVTSGGYNVSSDGSCAFSAAGDLTGVDPMIGPLADNGGSTRTHTPHPSSPALDMAGPGCPAEDQRSIGRPIDGDGDSSPACDAGAVEWEGNNEPPELDPIPDQSGPEGQALTFTATATDAGNDDLTFSLQSAPGGAHIDPQTGEFSWTPDEADGPGAYFVTVRVTDNGAPNMFDQRSLALTVAEANQPPSLSAITDQAAAEGDQVDFTLGASDPDLPANGLSFSAVGLPSGLSLDPETGEIGGTLDYTTAGTYTIDVTVSDGTDADQASFQWTVTDTNRSPQVSQITDFGADEQTPIWLQVFATDPDGDGLVFSFSGSHPSGSSIDPDTGAFTWTPSEAQGPGVHHIVIEVTDTGAPALSSTIDFYVTVGEVNRPPSLAPIADRTGAEGFAASMSVPASDPDLPADTLHYSATGLPSGLTIDSSTGLISGSIGYEEAGPHLVTVTVGDGEFQDQATFTWTVSNTDRPPFIDAISDRTIGEQTTLDLMVISGDPDVGDSVTFSLASPPSGASINSLTGRLLWTPGESQGPGSYQIRVQSTDTFGMITQETFVVTVDEVNRPPVLTPVPGQSGVEGQSSYLVMTATDPDLPANALIFSATGLPAGLTIDPLSGVISGTPTFKSAGLHHVTVTVSDWQLQRQQSFDWTIGNTNLTPTIGPMSDITTDELLWVSLTVPGSDPDEGDDLTYRLVGTIPEGATINPTSGRFRWAPSEPQGPGHFRVTFEVIDEGGLRDRAAIDIIVNEVNQLPLAVGDSVMSAEDHQLVFSPLGNDGDPDGHLLEIVHYSQPLQGSVSLDENGGFTYSPPLNWSGDTNFSYRIADGFGGFADADVYLHVTPVADWPEAMDDVIELTDYRQVPLDVLGNDKDADGDSLTIVQVKPASVGTVSYGNGYLVYTPRPSWVGVESFTYEVQDETGRSSVATVSVAIGTFARDQVTEKSRSVGTGLLALDGPPPPPASLVVTLGFTSGVELLTSSFLRSLGELGIPLLLLLSALVSAMVSGRMVDAGGARRLLASLRGIDDDEVDGEEDPKS